MNLLSNIFKKKNAKNSLLLENEEFFDVEKRSVIVPPQSNKRKKKENQNVKYNSKDNIVVAHGGGGAGAGGGSGGTGGEDDEEEPVPTVYCVSTVGGLQKNDRKWLKLSGITEEITIENFSVVLHVLNFLRRKDLIYYKFIDQPEQIIQIKESMALGNGSVTTIVPSVVISSVKSNQLLLTTANSNSSNNSQSSPIVCGISPYCSTNELIHQNQCSLEEFIVEPTSTNSNVIINNNIINSNDNSNQQQPHLNLNHLNLHHQQIINNNNSHNGTILQQQNNTILITPQSLSAGLSHSYYYPGKKKRIDANRVFISPSHFCKYPEEIDIAIEKLLNQGNPKELYKNLYFEAKGGFGSVFLAKNRAASHASAEKQMVAVKKMPHKTLRQKRMNLNEIGFLKYCNHPNIVKLLCSFLKNEELWLVMELMEGGTLREAVGNFSFCESKIAYICKETLKAISYLHSNGLCHRDLKSSNIMISMNGEIKLIDFGLAVDFNNEKEDIHMCGSPFWMPPEQILGRPHSLPVDIWSFGVCVVEMLKRKVPNHNSRLKAMVTIATEGLSFTKLEYPYWSDQVLDFLSKCLQTDPLKRASADELLAHPFLENSCDLKEIKDILPALFMSNTLSKQGIF
ncbi:hypothetical protein CYY_006000 [Polysphondylium violaceum]|uniref:Protein kinase domain-containing protein n=1 Tax=Polysphondylium violaceum TaxID=133409 RepID=A0A8J4PU80_9MYCE|nr:hypothetical protein CYY_006000 [Polysphondylium violaceum]